MPKHITLQDFIERCGAHKLAETLNVSHQNIYQWKLFQSSPRPETAAHLIELSEGQLSYESIYKPFVENRQLSFNMDV